MRLIDADALYEYLDDEIYTCNKYAEVEDILDIIKNQPTVNTIKVSPNLTNKGFIKKAFPNIEIVDEECNGIIYGYERSNSIKAIVPRMGFNAKWLKENMKRKISKMKKLIMGELTYTNESQFHEADQSLNIAIKELKRESREEYVLIKRLETEILRLESIISNQWISVEKKLPEEHYAVLVYCPQKKNTYCAYLDKGKWWIFGTRVQIVLKVVAWKLLPTPPQYNLCDTNSFNDERFGG